VGELPWQWVNSINLSAHALLLSLSHAGRRFQNDVSYILGTSSNNTPTFSMTSSNNIPTFPVTSSNNTPTCCNPPCSHVLTCCASGEFIFANHHSSVSTNAALAGGLFHKLVFN